MFSNYGAVLQCYALQRFLRNHTTDNVEVIDFTTEEHIRSLKLFGRKSSNLLKNIILNILVLRHYSALKRRQERTAEFKRDNINFTSRYIDAKKLLENPPKEDVYVTGSDQVFNLNSSFVDVYYLNFNKGNARKVAYAPSFGVAEFDNDYRKRVPKYIKDFDALSCREQTGAAFLSDLTGKMVPVVVDPTMLLSAEDWTKVAKKPKIEDYILIYDLNGKDNLVVIAKKIQNLTKSKIVCITSNERNRYDVDKTVFDAGPSEFVGWFANANYVVTDSFHGTSFSIIFNKPFSTYVAATKTSDRVRTLLGKFNLNWRLIENGKSGAFVANEVFLQEPNVSTKDYIHSSCQFIHDNILNNEEL